MLTLYYASATFLQSWRIQKVCTKISEQLQQQASIAFYALQTAADGFDTSFATSELCTNRNTAKVTEILWLHGNDRGCCLRPLQTLYITSWISFPSAPSLLPFAYSESETLSVEKCNLLNLLLETDIKPMHSPTIHEDVVRLEDYGKLIAWKCDSHLALLLETDVEHYTKLLIATFLQNNFLINDQLPLLRIQSVLYEGKPQPFELVATHSRKSTRQSPTLSAEAWQRHLADLHALSVLAQQATEFEYNKNRTEGKTGVVKPDLIPLEQKEKAETKTEVSTVTSTPAKSSGSQTRKISSPAEAKTISKPEKVQSASLTDTANKINLKPTDTIEPNVTVATVVDGRFKSTKVTESPPSKALPTVATITTTSTTPTVSPAKSTSKSSELEKIAAAIVTQKQKSPICTDSQISTATMSSVASSKATTATPSPKKTAATANSVEPQTSSSGAAVSIISASEHNSKRPSLLRNKDSLRESKPLNILVYADSVSARESTISTLRDLLARDMYTIYPLTPQQASEKHWVEQTALLVVCGSVARPIGEILVDYFLHGGKVLSLCSDILHFILPTYRTAEVREHELVQFSYDKWQKVKMMHHIFCYQPSPVKKHFSTESDDAAQVNVRKPALVCPRSIELKDLHGQTYQLDVKVLGIEETWNTPSLLLANSTKNGGKAVFSQIHLETNPIEFEFDESKFTILKQSDATRLEIFSDLLSKHLDVEVQPPIVKTNGARCVYKHAYFLGRHESKFELLEKLKSIGAKDNVIATRKLTMKFCGKDDKPPQNANNNVLPILIHSCPDDFSTVDYFDNLKTAYIGRLVIYAPIVNSSMNVINELELMHGIAVLPREQTEGAGRSNNQWLSPLGCAMFSIQLHIAMDTPLGARLPLIQHIIGAAIVNTLRGHSLYKQLDISLKWPNDIYANGINKIGGLVVTTILIGSQAIVNIGSGINLDNSKPTVCINELINDYNRRSKQQQQLPLLKYEQFVAFVFNEIERLVDQVQSGNFALFYKLYYELWLHNEQTIKICLKSGQQQDAKIIGIDDYGYLKVQLSNGTIESVQPDGNSFDMLKGLIVPKYN